MSTFDSRYFFPCRRYIWIAFEEILLTFADAVCINYTNWSWHAWGVSEVAWSAVSLHNKSMLSCIEFTVSLCQFSGLSACKSKDKTRCSSTKITKCFGYKPSLPSCTTCNKAVAVPLQRQWWQQWCCHHFESCQRLFCSFLSSPYGVSVNSL